MKKSVHIYKRILSVLLIIMVIFVSTPTTYAATETLSGSIAHTHKSGVCYTTCTAILYHVGGGEQNPDDPATKWFNIDRCSNGHELFTWANSHAENTCYAGRTCGQQLLNCSIDVSSSFSGSKGLDSDGWYYLTIATSKSAMAGTINYSWSGGTLMYSNQTGSRIRLTANGTYTCTISDSNESTTCTLTFVVTDCTYQVAFDANKPSNAASDVAGTMDPMTGLLFSTDYTLTANNFSLTGWDFNGWNTAAGGTGTAYADGATINNLGPATMYAQWTQKPYYITYDYNVPENTESTIVHTAHPSTVLYDVNITISNPSLLGYTFTGWEITGMDSAEHTYDGEKSTDTSANGVLGTVFRNLHSEEGTVTFKATWRPNQYTIHYDKNVPALANAQGNTGTGDTADSVHTYDVTGNLTINSFNIPGWNFTGWNTVADGSGTDYSNAAEVMNLLSDNNSEMTLYAMWTANTYPNRLFVRYQNSDGGYTEYESVPYKVNGADAGANSNVGHDSVITWSFTSTSHHQANSITWVVNSEKDEYVTVMRQVYSIAVANGLHCNSIDYTVLTGAETDTNHCYYAGSNIEITSGYVDGHFQDYTGTNTQNTQTFTIEDITQDYTYTANGVDHTAYSDDVVYLGTPVNIGTINVDGNVNYSLVNYNNQRCWAYYCPTCGRCLQHGTILDETVLDAN